MIKNEYLQKFNKLNIKQKVYFLFNILNFTFYAFKESLASLSKASRPQKSIAYISKLIKNSSSQVNIIESDNFDEYKIKINLETNPEISNFIYKVNNLSILESFIYKLITKSKLTNALIFILLEVPFLKKLKDSIHQIADSKLKLGTFFFRNNLYNLSIYYLKDLVKFHEDDVNLYYLLGTSYAFDSYNMLEINRFNINPRELLNYDKAIAYFKKALEIQPKNEKVLKELANIYYKTSKLNLSKEYYERALKLSSKDLEIYEKLGKIYKELNNKLESEKYLKLAKEIDSSQVKLNTSNIDMRLNKNSQSEHSVLGRKYKEIHHVFCLAILNFQENFDESVNSFNKGMVLILNDVDKYIFDAFAYKNKKNNKIADEYMETAINILKNNCLFIRRSGNSELNSLFDNYLPVGSIQKRLDIIDNYFNKNI